jgi:hypothetical protein
MAKTRYIIEAQDKVTPELKKIQREMKQFSDGFKNLAKTAATFFAVDALKDFGLKAYDAFAQKEVVMRRFGETLKRAGITSDIVANQFKELADKLEATAGIDDAQILNLASSYITLGRSSEEVYKLLTVASDLAAVTGDDLASSMAMLTKADAGQIAKMKAYIPELNLLTDAQIANGEAVDLIASKVRGMSEQIYGGAISSVNSFKQTWDDFFEATGKSIQNSGLVGWIEDMMKKSTDLIKLLGEFDEATGKLAGMADRRGGQAVQAKLDKNTAAIEYLKKAKAGTFNSNDLDKIGRDYGAQLTYFFNVDQQGVDDLIAKLEAQNKGNEVILNNLNKTSGKLAADRQQAETAQKAQDAKKQALGAQRDGSAEAQKKLADEWKDATISFDQYRAQVIEGYAQIGAEVDSESEAIDQAWADSVAGFNATKDAITSGVNTMFGAVSGLFGAWMDLENQRSAAVLANYDKELKNLDSKYEAEKKAKQDLGLSTADIDQQYEKQKEELEKERLAKENEFARKAFEANKVNTMASIVMNTANAVVGALGSFPFGPWNIALASGVGALGAAQLGLASQLSYTPKFADGGIVPGNSFSGDRVISRLNSGEMVLNQRQQAALFGMANGGGGGLVVNVSGVVGSPSDVAIAISREIDKQRALGAI